MGVHQMLLASSGVAPKSAYLQGEEFVRTGASPVGLRVDNDGYVYATNAAGTYTSRYKWLTGSGTGTDYDVRATVTSGSVSSGTTGSWLDLASDQTWTRTGTAGNATSVVLTVEIRDTATTNVLATASITLTCDMT